MPDESRWDTELSDDADGRMGRRITAIRRMRSNGARVITAGIDVMDDVGMSKLVASVRADAGHISVVIHAAGILHDALIALRTPRGDSPVVDVKAQGAIVLHRVLAADPPEQLILCSSVGSVIGLPGQIDYTAANAFLDALAFKIRREGRTRAVAINWSAWTDVGMAVDAARAAVQRDPLPPPSRRTVVELFDDVADDGDRALFTTRFSRDQDWLLAEHVIRGGDALLPGTGFLEIMRSAVTWEQTPPPAVELRDVYFTSPFAVSKEEVREAYVSWNRATSTVTVYSDAEYSPHAVATVRIVDHPGPTLRHDLAAVRARCTERVENVDGHSDQRFMEFGPRWGNLERVEFGSGEALVTTVMPAPFVHELRRLWLHPAVLDMATGSAQSLIPGVTKEDFYVPFSYGRVLVRGPLPERVLSHVRLRPSLAKDLAVFDVAVCDEYGNEVVGIEGFTMRRVPDGVRLTVRATSDSNALLRSSTTDPISAALREGMSPAEGVDALERILAAHIGPQVVACSVDLPQWIATVDADAAVPEPGLVDNGGPVVERPSVDPSFVGPQTPIERELAAMWQELLGVDEVGRDDDFFELGGQSLTAVRLFGRMRKKYSVDLALATLFEAPTIAQCAALVASALGIVDAPESGAEHAVADEATPGKHSERRSERAPFRSLVTIQKGGERTPFFCVHGAGGNVLNFRDLSSAMGRGQPFYGLQAQGVDGVLRPHTTIPEMARAYLMEVRAVQPQGPYIFGGYSGGGLVAYEMARQVIELGDQVDVVVLLDTVPVRTDEISMTLRMRVDRLRRERLDYIREMFTSRIAVRRKHRQLARVDDVIRREDVVPSELRELLLERSFGRAAKAYQLEPLAVRVVLLRAEERHCLLDSLGESYGWDGIVKDGVEVIRVPGNHHTLVLEPNARELVRVLRDTIQSAVTPLPGASTSGSAAGTLSTLS